MKCPFCGYEESKVVDSRPTDEYTRIRRRRECMKCAKRFTTYEMIEETPVIVVKKDNSRQMFDRNKLMNGMIKACEKRPVSLDVLEDAVSAIEFKLQNSFDREVSSIHIGELVMDALREIDDVAYIRFASVYKQFQDLDSFRDELNQICNK